MDIIVTDQIRERELDGKITEEIFKVLAKVKQTAETAQPLSSPGLPAGTVLRKVYATSPGGARRLLFFFQPHPNPGQAAKGERAANGKTRPEEAPICSPEPKPWYLLLYRGKGDPAGANMSPKNKAFVAATIKRLSQAIADLETSTAEHQKFTRI
jgi:hypothetical protein